jgi:hypothetical protein
MQREATMLDPCIDRGSNAIRFPLYQRGTKGDFEIGAIPRSLKSPPRPPFKKWGDVAKNDSCMQAYSKGGHHA